MSTFGYPSTAATLSTQGQAGQFDVTVDFLLQMANYLTERHTSQLRAHMLKAAAARGSNAPSPVPGAEPVRRTSSGAGRAPSALSMRKETATPLPKSEEEHTVPLIKSALPNRPGSSRNSSGNTAVPSANPQNLPGSRPGTGTRLTSDPQRRRIPYLQLQQQQQQQHQPQDEEDDIDIPPPSPAASSTLSASSSSSSSSSDSPVESRIIRRPPRFQPKEPRSGGGGNGHDPFGADDDDDDDDEPAFLPFNHQQGNSAQTPGSNSSGQDLGATLRGTNNMRDLAAAAAAAGGGAAARRRSGDDATSSTASHSQTSDSSIGSAAVVSRRRPTTAGAVGADGRRVPGAAGGQDGGGGGLRGGPLSPRRTAELAARGGNKGVSREGSDGTPSMGSSFSDLDDASVTQSALEEALASRMQDGTIGSRMSVIGGTIGQAIRSRYLPKPNRQ
ncbi:hypothetical protein C8A00DRAFT_13779 [Chaetomidium leptoderma]|uniref:Uncharacterized protein n=1 Tax=Chaetomidium leptoderma TaxID=669021 RepID=A0AAN6VPX6_9PEZI|nr:hypothetical protein C8A00DRAFT_13779 [Chaetomidium leptoderma]